MEKETQNAWGFVTSAQSVARWARERPDAVAVTERGMRFTYRDLATLIIQTTKYLDAQGVRSDMIVGIECSIRYLHLALIMACECLGATTVSLLASDLTDDNPLLPRCSILLSDEAIAPGVNGISLTHEVWSTIDRIKHDESDLESLGNPLRAESSVRIWSTSGTTGSPKFMHAGPSHIRHVFGAWKQTVDSLNSDYNFISLYQFTFSATRMASHLVLHCGGIIAFSSKGEFYGDLAYLKNCFTVLLIADAAQLSDAFSGTGQTTCGVVATGGYLPAALRKRLLGTFATEVVDVYGSNEAGLVALMNEDGSGNLLADTHIRILGKDGNEAPAGEAGVIAIRSLNTVKEYLWDESLTADHFDDGWFISSDMGYALPDGRFVLLGRVDDMLNIGGIKVPPQPVETAINALQGVRDAVLVSADNRMGIPELHVFVELTSSNPPTELHASIESIVFKLGCSFVAHYHTSLPRTHTGKVQRGFLKAMIPGHAGSVGG